jgi:predicted secreted protein
MCRQSSTLDAGAGYANYAWNNGTSAQTLVANTAGTYTVTVTDNNGCVGTDEFVLTINANPTPNIGGSTSFCVNGNTTLDAGAGYAAYNWNTAATTQTLFVNAPNTYTVTVTDNNGCIGTDAVTVIQTTQLSPNIVGNPVICSGASATLDAEAGYNTYAWNTGATSQTIAATTAGSYTVTVTDATGCSGTDNIAVTVNTNPTPQITGDDAVCAGRNINA